MTVFKQRGRATRIKGLSDTRILPRLGHIRLGIKVPHPKVPDGIPKEV